jgi:hypothetical protein
LQKKKTDLYEDHLFVKQTYRSLGDESVPYLLSENDYGEEIVANRHD